MDLPLPDYLLDILTLKKALILSTCYTGVVFNQPIAFFLKKRSYFSVSKVVIYLLIFSLHVVCHSFSIHFTQQWAVQWRFNPVLMFLLCVGIGDYRSTPPNLHSCSCCLYGWLELGLRLTPGKQTQGHSRRIDMPSGRPEVCSECWPGVTNQMMSKAASEWFVALLPQVKWYFPNTW